MSPSCLVDPDEMGGLGFRRTYHDRRTSEFEGARQCAPTVQVKPIPIPHPLLSTNAQPLPRFLIRRQIILEPITTIGFRFEVIGYGNAVPLRQR